ncbi:MAG: single-stranded-DNA-specific exonuclease RecJ [bacterium]
MTKKWQMKEPVPEEIAQELQVYSPVSRQILFSRGVLTASDAALYFAPDFTRDLHDPFLLKDMDKAVERLTRALSSNEKIVIFGDYDADGVPGTAVLTSFFDKIGFTNYDVYIPDRHDEDYGLGKEAISKLGAGGAKLIITVDCGITDIQEIDLANSLGIDVIITDHHLPQAELPKAYAIINAKQAGDQYPDKGLCGCGTAFKLVQALIKASNTEMFSRVLGNNPQTTPKHSDASSLLVPEGWEKWLLDLVAISTVSDMVPMVGENRALTLFGLKVLRRTPRVGLNSLFSSMNLDNRYINEDDIGFMVGPRINSASRMSHASQAYYLLTTNDVVRAKEIAAHLQEKNQERKSAVEIIFNTLDAQLKDKELPPVIVLGDQLWKLGVLGLAATRLVERYNRPVFLWSTNGRGEIKGSCRSDGTVSIVKLMELAGGNDFFINYGGHDLAGGFSVADDKAVELAERLASAYVEVPKEEVNHDLMVDSELTIDDIVDSLFEEVSALGPYGIGNSKPNFLIRNISVTTAKAFGNGGIHLELDFTNSRGRAIKAIGFFSYPDGVSRDTVDVARDHKFGDTLLEPGNKLDILVNIERSYFRGRPELRLRIVDLKNSGAA